MGNWGMLGVLAFEDGEDGNDPEVVTFRYGGDRLRIRHSLEAGGSIQQIFTGRSQRTLPARWPSKLELLEAREHPDKDERLASLRGHQRRLGSDCARKYNPKTRMGKDLSKNLRIAEAPQLCFPGACQAMAGAKENRRYPMRQLTTSTRYVWRCLSGGRSMDVA